jgi:hypothetical protein
VGLYTFHKCYGCITYRFIQESGPLEQGITVLDVHLSILDAGPIDEVPVSLRHTRNHLMDNRIFKIPQGDPT